MLRVFVLLAVLATAVHGNVLKPVPLLDGRIVGGKDTVIEDTPYQVSVRYFGSHICGGSILSESVVITAGHCNLDFSLSLFYSIQYGQTELGGSKNVVGVKRVLRHENYNSNTVDFDVALIYLSEDIEFGPGAQPIALARQEPPAGTAAIITGWGTTSEDGPLPKILQKVQVGIVDRSECTEKYKNDTKITDRMLCAGVSGGGKDSCQGDSGGPLVVNGQLAGVVSWGIGCARPDYPGVYSNVANLASWIDKKMP